MTEQNLKEENQGEEKSFFKIIVHSFFIIPFLIAVFCVLLFAGIQLLTQEKRTAYDYLEDIKTGGKTKRWQGAFELSKILANPKQSPKDDRFSRELISAFEHSKHDDNRVRQYIALAMGRTENIEYVDVLLKALKEEKEENLPAIIYALGMLMDPDATKAVESYVTHDNSRIRSIAVVALGNIGNSESADVLKKALHDQEANVQWGAAISLAEMHDSSGNEIIAKMLNREYFSQFPEVDSEERTQLMLAAISAVEKIKDENLMEIVKNLSKNDPNMQIRSKALEVINTN